MKWYERIFVFIGDFAPLYLIVYIIYFSFTLNAYFSLVVVPFLCNLVWLFLLSNENLKNSNVQNFELESFEDVGTQMTAYFLSYAISIPSVTIVGGVRGVVVLAIFMSLFFVLFHGNKIMLYNPFLSVFGYKVYKITVVKSPTQVPSTYIISKGEKLTITGKIKASQIEDYIYVQKTEKRSVT